MARVPCCAPRRSPKRRASRCNKLTWGTELFGPLLLTEEIVTEAPVYRDFQLEVPRTPGLGLTLDEERLAFFARK